MDNNSFENTQNFLLNKNQINILEEILLNPDTTKFNNTLLIKFDSWIDLTRLKESVEAAVKYHSFMNARICKDNNGRYYLKKINSENDFTTKDIEELNHKSEDIEIVKNTLAKPFDIFNERLFRVKFVNAKGNYIFLEMHQLIGDEASLHVFLEDVSQAYLQYEINKEEITGYDYLIAEKESSQTEKYSSAKKYFFNIIDQADTDFKLIGNIKNPNLKKSETKELVSRRAIADMIKSYCQINSLTVEGFFTAAFCYLLSEYNAGKNSLFSTIYSGRNNPRLKNTVAMLAKTLPVFCNIEGKNGSVSVIDFIKSVDNQLVESKNNSIYSFDELAREKELRTNIIFYFQGEDYNFYSFCGKISKPVEIHSEGVKCPILFRVSIHGAEITFNIDYDAALYSSEFIDCFLDAYDVVISEFMMKQQLSEVETTSYKVVKLINSLKTGKNANVEILDLHGKLIPPGAFGYLCKSTTVTRWEI